MLFINSIIEILIVSSFLIQCFGIYVLYHLITHVYGDACVLLHLSNSLKGLCKIEKNFAGVSSNKNFDHMEKFASELYFFNYNVFLHIVKMFPDQIKLRGAQISNLIIFIFFQIGLFMFQYSSYSYLGLNRDLSIAIALLMSLLIGIRSKMLYWTMFPSADIIGYMTLSFIMNLLILKDSSSFIHFMLLGLFLGIAIRNRFIDFMVFVSCILFLLIFNVKITNILLCIATCFIIISDMFYCHFFLAEKYETSLEFIYRNHVVKSGQPESIFKVLWSLFWGGIKKALNFKVKDSLWTSQGISLLVLPISICLLVFNKSQFLDVYYFLFLYGGIYFFVSLFIRKRLPQKKRYDETYLGTRLLFPLFIVLMLINGLAFAIAVENNYVYLSITYLLYFLLYIVFQLYRFLIFYKTEKIDEKEMPVFHKIPDAFRVELAEQVKKIEQPATIAGFYLHWGEIYNFFDFSRHLRVLSLTRKLSDREIENLIKQYSITHIILTPISDFIGPDCSITKNNLNQMWQQRLKEEYKSQLITIYKVQ